MRKFDAIIIGFGKAGKTLAAFMANSGKEVALVEKSSKMYGGACINIACIPTKTLVSAAERDLDFSSAIQLKTDVVSRLNQKNYKALADSQVAIIDGNASFVDQNTIKIDSGDDSITVSADNIFINTGAVTQIPNIPGINETAHIYTSTTLLDETTKPESLAIIGGGFIGLEFASTYAKFGTKVTVYESGDSIAFREDPQIASAIIQYLELQGVEFKLSSNIKHVFNDDANRVVIKLDDGEEKFDAVLVATGRVPYTENLNLELAGVKTNDRGAVIVDDQLRTSAPNIWAMGDVTGAPQFTFLSLDDFRIIRSQLFGDGSYTRASRKPYAFSVFMQTPYARIGMNEKEARQASENVAVKEMPAAAIPRLHVDNRTNGLLRAIVDTKTKKILGAALFCENAHEIINIIKLAMDAGLDYTVLRDQIFTHPSVPESLNDLFNI